jgi:polysaccharide deacetylase family protein (PEP-CTERM system associated)
MSSITRPAHFFTIDVEEHFHVSAFDGVVDRADWERLESRVERHVGGLLDLLARHDTLATFFTVGWVARKDPALVRRIADAGHEVASLSFWHRKVSRLTPAEFRSDIRDCKAALEAATGQPVRGFRAPTFSIRPGGEWAFDVLLEEGHVYDSSLFPIHRPDYGYPSAPSAPHVIRRPAGALLELPLATFALGRARLPAAGGGYLRQFPLALVRRAFRQYEARGIPGMFYVHPWEIDPDQPRIAAPWLTRVRHYRGLERTLPRLERLLTEFRFTSVAAAFGLDARAPTDPWPGLAVA